MSVSFSILGRTLNYQPLWVRTPDGVRISVQDHGGTGRDVLFIHGYSQASLAWLKQVTSPLAARYRLVTYDLRGHGASEKPEDPTYYRESARWAAEVGAVIETLGLRQPVLVAWSYGGRVALDFLERAGAGAIAGLVQVAATSTARPEVMGPSSPKLRGAAIARDLAENVVACVDLLAACTAKPLPVEEHALVLGWNMGVPPRVRLALAGREAAYDEVLSSLDAPVLAIHGARDLISSVAMSRHTVATAAYARQFVYDDSGHMPFWEEPERFNADLAEFIDSLAPPGMASPVPDHVSEGTH